MKTNTIKQYYIYKITCTVNGKSYIGQTVNPQHRFYKCHQRNKKMLADIERYGVVAFQSEILARTTDKKLSTVLEEHFVDEYDTIENGYNSYRCFKVPAGLKRTPEANAKRSKAISNTVWMTDPVTGQSTRVNPTKAKELEAQGWKPGRVCDKSPYMKGSAKNKLFGVNIPDGSGDYFKPSNK